MAQTPEEERAKARERMRKRREQYPEKVRAERIKWQRANRDKINEYNRDRYEDQRVRNMFTKLYKILTKHGLLKGIELKETT